MSIIKSGTTSTTAYTVEANTNGDLEFQVNGSLTALSIDSSGAVSLPASSLTTTSGATLNGGVVVNEDGADVDFRVEGDTDANLFYVNAGNDRIGVGTNTPTQKLSVNSGAATTVAHFASTGSSAFLGLGNSGAITYIGNDSTSGNFIIQTPPGSYSTKLTLDPSGNLGLGVTPETWQSTRKVLSIGSAGSVVGPVTGIGSYFRVNNAYLDSSGVFKYTNDGAAAYSNIGSDGSFAWNFAASGTAGQTATFSQPMTLTTAGNLGVGTTLPAAKLEIYNSSVNGAFVANTTSTWRVVQVRNDQTSTSGSAAGIAFVGKDSTQPAGIVAINDNTTGGVVNLAFLTVDGNVTTERVRISSTGIVTTPYQPSFSAYLAANENRSSGTSVVGGTWATQHNTGGHYSTSTRRFTAPVSGVYVFQCIIATAGGTGTFSYLSAELWINGGRLRTGGWGGGGSSYGQTSNSFTIYLNANDYAELASEASKAFTLQSGLNTIFAGYLVG